MRSSLALSYSQQITDVYEVPLKAYAVIVQKRAHSVVTAKRNATVKKAGVATHSLGAFRNRQRKLTPYILKYSHQASGASGNNDYPHVRTTIIRGTMHYPHDCPKAYKRGEVLPEANSPTRTRKVLTFPGTRFLLFTSAAPCQICMRSHDRDDCSASEWL
jgi:hypothetical protein